MRLDGKLAVITAAASGMGRAGCERFLREGASVAAVDIDGNALDRLVKDMAGAGRRVVPIVTDMSSPQAVKQMIGIAAAELGGIDILWNHAGSAGPADVEDLDIAVYDKWIALNVTSGLVASGEVAAWMRKRGGGSILFTSSISGVVGSMMSPVYSAGKFGVVGLAKALALRFACDGIRVNAICPGTIETPMLANFMSRANNIEEIAANRARFEQMIPLGRVGRPEEIAQAALWLASDESSYVTGIALPVDGGFTAR